MNYKIVIDSCGELPEDLKKDARFETIPLTLMVDEVNIIDDETFDQKDFIRRVSESPHSPKSACPSPERYMQSYKGDYECVFVITLSEQLSGSYNSAFLGKELYFEEVGKNTKIHVFNSRSASIGQTLIALKVKELIEQGKEFEEIVSTTEAFIGEMETFFVLETLETLRKNGRLTNIQAILASVLNIKPVMGATKEGTIYKIDQARGITKALAKMIDVIQEKAKNAENKILAISHCNCPERAAYVKEQILKYMKVKDIIVLDSSGVTTMYANDGGIVVAI
ncbi:MAG: DegV family protein [Clostridiales bacterium]|nr:DegV family protein [Clostridiales bacterium]